MPTRINHTVPAECTPTTRSAGLVRAGLDYQSLTLHNNAGLLRHGSDAAKPEGPAIPNVVLLEAPWASREAATDATGVPPAWPYPKIEDGHALPLERPGLGIEANGVLAGRRTGRLQALCAFAAGPTSAWTG
jgi:hypothetical protein